MRDCRRRVWAALFNVDGINSTDHTAEVVGYWQRYTISADFSSAASYLSRYTGTDAENPGRPEIEHFGNCDVCGALVDMRDLAR